MDILENELQYADKGYKSFMVEGFSIGAHAESLYSRGYKHYGTMGQGNKAVHIFTPAHPGKHTPEHHLLLKHDGNDPVRHEGKPDLKAIKAMTESVNVQAIQKERETKAQRADRNIQTKSVKEALPSNAKAGDYIDDFVHSKNKMFKGDSKKQRIKRALGAYYGHQKEEAESIFEGWLFGDRYTKIGNRGATHRITFSHTKMNNKKHTVDVTAPTDQHAINHVHRYVSGGNYSAPIKVLKIQHLHEGAVEDALAKQRSSIEAHAARIKQAKLDNTKNITGPIQRTVRKLEKNHVWQPKTPDKPFRKKRIDTLIKNAQKNEDLVQEVSKSTLKSYVKKAEKNMDDTYKNEKSPKKWDHVTWKRAVGITRAEKRLDKKEDLDEALDIRHAINHPDSQARHHARKFRDHSKTANDIANMRVFPDQAYDYAHHYTAAIHHAKEYRKRLGQLEAGTKKEDLSEGGFMLTAAHKIKMRIKNAVKNANKKLKPTAQRIADTRKKVGYDNAKGKDLSPRGNALRRVEKIEWAKQNPVKKKKDIVPMGKLPDKVWEGLDEALRRRYGRYKSPEERDQERRVDHNDARRKAVTSWSIKTPDEKGKAVKHAASVDKLRKTLAAKKKAANAALRAANKEARAKAAHEAEYQKKDAIGKVADDMKNRPFGKPSPHAPAAKAPEPEKTEFQKKLEAEKHRQATRPFGGRSYTGEELEPKDSDRKFLKEKPKRDPMTGRLAKSKTAQKVEDCIKMSGKKEKIDTEPSYNPLTTAGGGGSPNA